MKSAFSSSLHRHSSNTSFKLPTNFLTAITAFHLTTCKLKIQWRGSWRSTLHCAQIPPEQRRMAEMFTVKVEEATPAGGGRPAAGPVYRSVYAKDGLMELPPDIQSPWDFFRFGSWHCVLCVHNEFPSIFTRFYWNSGL